MVPQPNPLRSLVATAALPFSIQGVIFANKTSPSAKCVNPLRTSLKGRSRSLLNSGRVSLNAGIGANDTKSSSSKSR